MCKPPSTSCKKIFKKTPEKIENIEVCNSVTSPIVLDHRQRYKAAKCLHRRLTNFHKARDSNLRDERLLKNPSSTFASIRNSRIGRICCLNNLYVGDRLYQNEAVKDGKDDKRISCFKDYQEFGNDYYHILELNKYGYPLRALTEIERFKLLL